MKTRVLIIRHRITAEIASKIGPIIPGSISVPAYLRKKLGAAGRDVPESIHGRFFIDTTSRQTVVASQILDRLKLFPSSLSGDEVLKYVYIVEVGLFGNQPTKPQGAGKCSWVMPVQAIGATYPYDHAPEEQVIAHLGTDLLNKVEFSYSGPEGLVSLSIDPSRLIF